MAKKNESPSFSFKGWDMFYFLKDRRKSLVACAAAGLAFVVSDNELAAVLAGMVVEAGFSLAEFYLRKLEL